MPSDANLQEPGADDEPFAQDTGKGFNSSAYSEFLNRGLADIRTPVVPHFERHAQPEAPRKKSAEPDFKQKHHHSKTKRARRNSHTKTKAPAVSSPKSSEANTPTPSRRLLPVAEASARSTPSRKAAEQTDISRPAIRKERTPPD